MNNVYETHLSGLAIVNRGKVRDLYAINSDSLLMVTSDRLSAFDRVFRYPVPGKGIILTDISNFWFSKIGHVVPHHLLPVDPESIVSMEEDRRAIHRRAVVVKRLTPIPIESVVRGHLAGSGWNDYKRTGKVSDISLPPGIVPSKPLLEPIWTPFIKASNSGHDQICSFDYVANLVGKDIAEKMRSISIDIYKLAYDYALDKELILVDTKMEFGLDKDGTLYIMDELLTPDSSRYWRRDSIINGSDTPFSLDKQYIRDYWRKMSYHPDCQELPDVPSYVIDELRRRYDEVHGLILGYRAV
ncbi:MULTISPECIES: phosphoribosylaminoimidazolesuccinocarboxamide synthase [Candidatus Ichthyocystis]|uniref:phosphoribosylaminoimidazolesuccinocarboxamide synthase n=1 Tax=Candidatus Ichthyocystis TaxID=2929841 RepID=UPI000AC2BB45|nr:MULTISPECIES: phosphoribosylaminoimidazolesuccinocarboxamide synthase [Ichthyocystis]